MMQTTTIPISTPFLPPGDCSGSAGTATWREIQQICKSHNAARQAECIRARQFASRQALYNKLDSMMSPDAAKAPLLILDGDAEDNEDLIRCLNLRYMCETYEQRGQPTTVRIKDRRRRT